jgi:hypothetical protein
MFTFCSFILSLLLVFYLYHIHFVYIYTLSVDLILQHVIIEVRLCGCLNPWPTLVGFFLLVLSLTWEENNNMRVLWFVPIIDQYGIISNHTHYCAKQCTVFFNVQIVGFQLDVLLTVHVWSWKDDHINRQWVLYSHLWSMSNF